MCGISGIFKFNGVQVAENEINQINNLQEHRGKDFAAIITSNSVSNLYKGIALGHRRLSIIDLDESASQPMFYQEKRYCITYNGELYNYLNLKKELVSLGHTFRTNSDTEVILASYAQWGKNCLSFFDGMFAFAIWDEKYQNLFCVRDPIGIKPFYFLLDDKGFKFASESQALVRHSKFAIDENGIYSFLFSMYVPNYFSIYDGVKKLAPGSYLLINTKGIIEEKKYWNIKEGENKKGNIQTEAAYLLKQFDNAVDSQLVSDVPVGAFLSGGFDSGMIVASASRLGNKMHTYSAGFDDGKQFNELPISKSLAEKYGTIHHERIIASNEIIGILDKSLSSMSEPVADSAIVPTYALSEMASRDGVKVLLSGTGGDEVLGGYLRYIGYNTKRYAWNKVPFGLKNFIGNNFVANAILKNRLQSPQLDLMILTGGCPSLTQSIFKDKNDFQYFLKDKLIKSFPTSNMNIYSLYRSMHFDIQVYLPDLLLYTLDQLTMAHTVEGRVPMLRTDFINDCFNYHPKMHVKANRTKLLMREMAKDRLDPRTLTAKKQGFSGPIKHWILNNKKEFKERVMAAKDIPYLSQLNVEQYWKDEKSIHINSSTEIFAIFCLSTWYYNKLNN
jgi:asparagine synthase (glutamine-hydrolysing)